MRLSCRGYLFFFFGSSRMAVTGNQKGAIHFGALTFSYLVCRIFGLKFMTPPMRNPGPSNGEPRPTPRGPLKTTSSEGPRTIETLRDLNFLGKQRIIHWARNKLNFAGVNGNQVWYAGLEPCVCLVEGTLVGTGNKQGTVHFWSLSILELIHFGAENPFWS